jgi:uncharacterized protein (DUF433 family)
MGDLARLETDLAETLAEEDVLNLGATMEPGSLGAVLVYENLWAAGVASAIRHAGGQLVTQGRIPVQALIAAVEMTEDVSEGLEGFAALASVRSGLLGDDEIAEAASAMEPGTVAALIVYENLWAIPFIAAAREAGGDVIASARIPAEDVMAALDSLESDSTV